MSASPRQYWLFKHCCTALNKAKSRTALQRPKDDLVLLIIIDSELRAAIWVCHERHFLANITVECKEGISH